jgi:hypothetical protein
MILYDKNQNKEVINIISRINSGQHGIVYRTSKTECIKVYNDHYSINIEVLELIKELKLKNFYDILKLYYARSGIFKAIKMKYYHEEDIDILTMPTEYTLDSLYALQKSAEILTQNNIQIEDTHTGNIILTNEGIIVIDVDLYSFNKFRTLNELQNRNIGKIGYVFKELFAESFFDNHSDIKNINTIEVICELFSYITPQSIEKTYKKLVKYKYPIDYILKETK